MTNILDLAARRQARQDSAEKATPFDALNIPGKDYMTMSLQHQLQVIYQAAIDKHNEIIIETKGAYPRLLDVAKMVFANVVFPIDVVCNVECQQINSTLANGDKVKEQSVGIVFFNANRELIAWMQLKVQVEAIREHAFGRVDHRDVTALMDHQCKRQFLAAIDNANDIFMNNYGGVVALDGGRDVVGLMPIGATHTLALVFRFFNKQLNHA